MKRQPPEIYKRYQKYLPGILIVKLRQDVLANVPGAFAAAPRGTIQLPSLLKNPLNRLRRTGLIREVIPVFADAGQSRLTGREEMFPQHKTIAGAFAASIRDTRNQDLKGINVLKMTPKADVVAIEKELGANLAIEYVHRAAARWIVPWSSLPTKVDAPFTQWNLKAIYARTRADASSIRVGLLDTGVDRKHPNLPKLGGYHYKGSSSNDVIGHGTHVAGIICGHPTKEIPLRGVCRCDLYVWKIFKDVPDSTDGLDYVDVVMYQRALNDARNEGMQVINLSMGGTAPDQTEAFLIQRLLASGTTVVAAMGNDRLDGNPISYPAAFRGVVAVGATDLGNDHADFSCTGRHIALCAPGVDIVSTLPMKASKKRRTRYTRFGRWNGTSMAAPHVTAAIALLIAAGLPGRAVDRVKRLTSTATRLPGMQNHRKTAKYGYGLLNIKAALK